MRVYIQTDTHVALFWYNRCVHMRVYMQTDIHVGLFLALQVCLGPSQTPDLALHLLRLIASQVRNSVLYSYFLLLCLLCCFSYFCY